MKKYFITGVAGFIGCSLALYLLNKKCIIIGIDSIDSYYSKKFKLNRLNKLKKFNHFKFFNSKIDEQIINKIFSKHNDIISIFHFAAQPGVEFSEKNSYFSFSNNTLPLIHICSNLSKLKSLKSVYVASSSSVYGNSKSSLLNENTLKNPSSLYGFSKLTLEGISNFYSKKLNLKFINMRFFTVFGPLGRPDMAVFQFIKNIVNGETIHLYNKGNNRRDFTFINDLLNMIFSIMVNEKKIKSNLLDINLANGISISTHKLVKLLSSILNKSPRIKLLPKRSFEMVETRASTRKIKSFLLKTYNPTNIKDALKITTKWYLENYKW